MDNVLFHPGARAFQLTYSQSYCSTLVSMSVSNALPCLQKSLFMTWDGLKKRGMKQKQSFITVVCHIGDIPARDRKMLFGKYKGKMLGSLPSSFLRWMVEKTYPDAEWSAMAEEVLEDPVYRDRMEWEILDEAVKGSVNRFTKKSSVSNIPDKFRLCARFGWDPWGEWNIDYNLLGTSQGKRIPRIKDSPQHEYMLNLVMQEKGLKSTSRSEILLSENQIAEIKLKLKKLIPSSRIENLVSENAEVKPDYKSNDNGSKGLKSEIDMRRDARRERQKLRSRPVKTQSKQQPGDARIFPGRGALLRRISDAESRD